MVIPLPAGLQVCGIDPFRFALITLEACSPNPLADQRRSPRTIRAMSQSPGCDWQGVPPRVFVRDNHYVQKGCCVNHNGENHHGKGEFSSLLESHAVA